MKLNQDVLLPLLDLITTPQMGYGTHSRHANVDREDLRFITDNKKQNIPNTTGSFTFNFNSGEYV